MVVMTVYNKLVRDRIPEIITATGKQPECRVLGPDEYRAALDRKLDEELREYVDGGNVEELVDLVEVAYALAEYAGLSAAEFEAMRQAKRAARGGFERCLLLIQVGEA